MSPQTLPDRLHLNFTRLRGHIEQRIEAFSSEVSLYFASCHDQWEHLLFLREMSLFNQTVSTQDFVFHQPASKDSTDWGS